MNELFESINESILRVSANDFDDRGTLQDSAMKKFTTSTALIIIEGDLVRTYTNPDVEFSNESIEENMRQIRKHMSGTKLFSLFIPHPTTHITVEARTYRPPGLEEIFRAEALVIDTLAHRILANFYGSDRSEHEPPVRIFSSEESALDWFDEIRMNG